MPGENALRTVGGAMVLGIRGARAGDASLEADLEACARIGASGVILFDRDVHAGGARNVRDAAQLRDLCAYVRERMGERALVCVDQEGGRVRRLGPAHDFADHPGAAAVAGLPGSAQRACAGALAEELASVGIGVNFAPCVDVALVPDGAVIGALGRSYGDNAERVIACAERFIDAHDARGVRCVLKHFPGHGSASLDSHHALCDITATWARETELAPYRALMERCGAVMTGHLLLRSIDPDLPASLSHRITTGLLREELGFGGVVVTDSIDMEGVRARWGLEETIARALGAGADLVVHACNSARGEYAPDVEAAVRRVAGDERVVRLARAARERVDRWISARA
jgi:beta-N-acetylhexosaminidase